MRRIDAIVDILTRAVATASGLLLAAGATAKLMDARPAFEVAFAVVHDSGVAMALVAMAAVVEAAFVLAWATGTLDAPRAARVGATVLTAYAAWLAVARSIVGGETECGCLSGLVAARLDDVLIADALVVGTAVLTAALRRWRAAVVTRAGLAGCRD